MALPGDVTTFTLSFGPYTDASGAVVTTKNSKGDPLTAKLHAIDLATGKRLNVTHVATGQVVVPKDLTVTIGSDGTGSIGPLPHTDNPGLSTVGFGYYIEWDIATGSHSYTPGNKRFAVPAAAGATVDFDLLDVAAAVPGVLVPMGVSAGVADAAVSALLPGPSLTQAAFDGRYATDAELAAGLGTKVNTSTYTAGLAGKQDTTTLAAATAAQVSNGSALDVALRAAFAPLGAFGPSAPLPARRTVTKIVDFGTAGHGWSVGTQPASSDLNDTTNFARGSQSARVTTKGTGQVTAIFNSTMPAMNLTGKRFEVSVMVDDWTHAKAILLYLGDTGFANFRVLALWDRTAGGGAPPADNGQWVTLTADLSAVTSTTGTPNLAAVTLGQIAVQDDNTANAVTMRANHIGHFPGSATYPNGVVSFTFDDSYKSQRTIGSAYLERYNYQGTFYTIADQVGSNAYYLTASDLRTMQDVGGHEIGAHAYTVAAHNAVGGLTSLTPTALDQELRALKNWLVTNGFRGADHFAYPQGMINTQVETAVRNYFGSGRAVQFPVETWNPANPWRLRTGFKAGTPSTLAQGKAAVDAALANGSWSIIMVHDLVTTPPTPPGTTLPQWDISSYQQLVDYVASKGIPVRTVGDVLATA